MMPIARQMMLEIKARTNQSDKLIRKFDGRATDIVEAI
jgi:hypothetical protein